MAEAAEGSFDLAESIDDAVGCFDGTDGGTGGTVEEDAFPAVDLRAGSGEAKDGDTRPPLSSPNSSGASVEGRNECHDSPSAAAPPGVSECLPASPPLPAPAPAQLQPPAPPLDLLPELFASSETFALSESSSSSSSRRPTPRVNVECTVQRRSQNDTDARRSQTLMDMSASSFSSLRSSNYLCPQPLDGYQMQRSHSEGHCLMGLSASVHQASASLMQVKAAPELMKECCLEMDVDSVQELIAAGVSVNTPYYDCHSDGFVTILHDLCSVPLGPEGEAPAGSLAVMELLMQALANVNPRSSLGRTPLMCACIQKNQAAVGLLLEASAEVSPLDDWGFDCLLCAIMLDPSRPEGRDPANSRSPSKATGLSSMPGASVGFSNDDQSFSTRRSRHSCSSSSPGSLTHKYPSYASLSCSSEESGADGEFAMPPSETESRISAQLVRMIFRARARKLADARSSERLASNIYVKRPDRMVTIRLGSISDLEPLPATEHEAMIESWALGQPIDEVRRCKSTTPLAFSPMALAVRHLNHQAAAELLEHGALPVCLHEAVLVGSIELVQVLLKAKADPTTRDQNGDSAMDLALRIKDNTSLMDALRDAAKSFCYVGSGTGADRSSRQRRGRSSGRASIGSRLSNTGRKDRNASDRDCEELGVVAELSYVGRPPGFLARVGRFVSLYSASCSHACRLIHNHRFFQKVMFCTLIGTLFMPDLWVLLALHNNSVMDGILLFFLACFVFEIVVHTIGYWRGYLMTFFFYMDVLGALSVLIDLSLFRDMSGPRQAMGGNAVIMRAARAAKLAARAGRITRLVKLMRFLPSFPSSQDTPKLGTAHGLTAILTARITTRVACLIILLVMVLPMFSVLSYPGQDYSMQMWAEQLADALREESPAQVEELLQDFYEFFKHRTYKPHRYCRGGSGASSTGCGKHAEEFYWRSPGPLQTQHELQVSSGDLVVYFDFFAANCVESGCNILVVIFTIFLMVSFSLIISQSVSTIAVKPLEVILSEVRSLGSTLYNNVQMMQASHPGDVWATEGTDGCKHDAPETALLECAVRKLANLSELTMAQMQPTNSVALQYLGQAPSTHSMYSSSSESYASLWELRQTCEDPSIQEAASELWLPDMGTWQFNPHTLLPAQGCSACLALLACAVAHSGIEASHEVLQAFCEESIAGYLPGPSYHNWCHAVDTMHVLHLLMQSCKTHQSLIFPIEEVALLAAAVCHDLGHLGVSNDFLVNSSHELAIRYNDRSPLENFSCARMFEILTQPRCDVFHSLQREQFMEVRGICVEAILDTDSVHHVSMVKKLQMFGEVHSKALLHAMELNRGKHVSGEEDNHWPSEELVDILLEADSRQLFRGTMLHLADISNPTRPWEICKEWAICVIQEFFAQGDAEKARGLPVSPLNDREKTNFPFSQIGFIEFFVAPLVIATVRIVVPLEELLERLVANMKCWVKEWQAEVNPPEEELQSLENRVRKLEDKVASSSLAAVEAAQRARTERPHRSSETLQQTQMSRLSKGA